MHSVLHVGSLQPLEVDIRPCERKCLDKPVGCGEWKHHSRFRSYKTRHGRLRTESASISFSPLCKACEQKRRDQKKNANRPGSTDAGLPLHKTAQSAARTHAHTPP